MLKNFFPNKILSTNNKLINVLLFLMHILIFVGLMYALFLSPPDYIQGDSVRIMYVHVPSSFIALTCFGFIGIFSILNLIFKIKIMSLMAKSLAPVGCIFALVSIVTGSLWGKPTWGTWWVWDARLTSMAILFLFYIAKPNNKTNIHMHTQNNKNNTTNISKLDSPGRETAQRAKMLYTYLTYYTNI